MLQNTNFSNGHEEYKTDSTCVSRKKAHSIRRIGEGIRCQIVVIVPYSYIFFLVSDVHIDVMVDGVGGDMVCDQNTLHGHPLSDKRYWDMMVSLKKMCVCTSCILYLKLDRYKHIHVHGKWLFTKCFKVELVCVEMLLFESSRAAYFVLLVFCQLLLSQIIFKYGDFSTHISNIEKGNLTSAVRSRFFENVSWNVVL